MNYIVINQYRLQQTIHRAILDSNSLDKVKLFANQVKNHSNTNYQIIYQGEDSCNDISLPGAISEWDWLELLQQRCPPQQTGQLLYLQADTPLLNVDLTLQLEKLHQQYRADYSFAEGYPVGLVPEIISLTALAELQQLALTTDPFNYSCPRSILMRNINHFAVENLVRQVNINIEPIELRCNNNINIELLQRCYRAGATANNSPLPYLENNPEQIRTLPAAVNLQISARQPQPHAYFHHKSLTADTGGDDLMDPQLIRDIIRQIEQFSPAAFVTFLEIGEAATYPRITELLSQLLANSKLNFVIETCGVGWQSQELLPLLAEAKKRIHWIVALDTIEKECYRQLRGEGLPQALDLIELLQQSSPQQLYVQAVRMTTNDPQLQTFYNYWQKKQVKVIIQKYNDYAGLLANRQPANYQPLTPIPCRRLRRELAINLKGEAFLCVQDLYHRQHLLGNFYNEDIGQIWQRGQPFYYQHHHGQPPPICRACDEYSVWNF